MVVCRLSKCRDVLQIKHVAKESMERQKSAGLSIVKARQYSSYQDAQTYYISSGRLQRAVRWKN